MDVDRAIQVLAVTPATGDASLALPAVLNEVVRLRKVLSEFQVTADGMRVTKVSMDLFCLARDVSVPTWKWSRNHFVDGDESSGVLYASVDPGDYADPCDWSAYSRVIGADNFVCFQWPLEIAQCYGNLDEAKKAAASKQE